jgi:hypothetical protein
LAEQLFGGLMVSVGGENVQQVTESTAISTNEASCKSWYFFCLT